MIGEKTAIWKEGEYSYPAAYGFVPFIVSYIHEDDKIRPAMLVAPGGAYRYASPYEGNLPALEFYRAGYNVFVLAYTVNHLDELDAPEGRPVAARPSEKYAAYLHTFQHFPLDL